MNQLLVQLILNLQYQFKQDGLFNILAHYDSTNLCDKFSIPLKQPNLPSSQYLENDYGENCIYGFQCKSKYCDPRIKICMLPLDHHSSSPNHNQNTVNLNDIHDTLTLNLIKNNNMCSHPYNNIENCTCNSYGEPTPPYLDPWTRKSQGWDQSKCGCSDLQMNHQQSGLWVCKEQQLARVVPEMGLSDHYLGNNLDLGGNNNVIDIKPTIIVYDRVKKGMANKGYKSSSGRDLNNEMVDKNLNLNQNGNDDKQIKFGENINKKNNDHLVENSLLNNKQIASQTNFNKNKLQLQNDNISKSSIVKMFKNQPTINKTNIQNSIKSNIDVNSTNEKLTDIKEKDVGNEFNEYITSLRDQIKQKIEIQKNLDPVENTERIKSLTNSLDMIQARFFDVNNPNKIKLNIEISHKFLDYENLNKLLLDSINNLNKYQNEIQENLVFLMNPNNLKHLDLEMINDEDISKLVLDLVHMNDENINLVHNDLEKINIEHQHEREHHDLEQINLENISHQKPEDDLKNSLKNKQLDIHKNLNEIDQKIKEYQIDRVFLEKELNDLKKEIEEKIGVNLDIFYDDDNIPVSKDIVSDHIKNLNNVEIETNQTKSLNQSNLDNTNKLTKKQDKPQNEINNIKSDLSNINKNENKLTNQQDKTQNKINNIKSDLSNINKNKIINNINNNSVTSKLQSKINEKDNFNKRFKNTSLNQINNANEKIQKENIKKIIQSSRFKHLVPYKPKIQKILLNNLKKYSSK